MKLWTLLCVLGALLLGGCEPTSTQVEDSTLGHVLPVGETHLTFTFPELPAGGSFKGRPAVTFRIPREYVRFQGVLSKNGQIYQVPLQIELPGPTPWQDHSWLKGKQGTPEWDEFMKGWIGKFIVTVGAGSGVGGRDLFLNSIDPKNVFRRVDMIADGEAYGLVRYSPKRCFANEHLNDPKVKALLDSKPTDDPTHETNCMLSRPSAEYFSQLSITDPEGVVFISCADASCHANFNFSGRGASISFRQEQLSRWASIVNPTRDLLHSFIVRDTQSTASSPPAATALSR